MGKFNRVFVVVCDSMGMGAMPDADDFGDHGVDTLGHIADTVESFEIPNLFRIDGVPDVPGVSFPGKRGAVFLYRNDGSSRSG